MKGGVGGCWCLRRGGEIEKRGRGGMRGGMGECGCLGKRGGMGKRGRGGMRGGMGGGRGCGKGDAWEESEEVMGGLLKVENRGRGVAEGVMRKGVW